MSAGLLAVVWQQLWSNSEKGQRLGRRTERAPCTRAQTPPLPQGWGGRAASACDLQKPSWLLTRSSRVPMTTRGSRRTRGSSVSTGAPVARATDSGTPAGFPWRLLFITLFLPFSRCFLCNNFYPSNAHTEGPATLRGHRVWKWRWPQRRGLLKRDGCSQHRAEPGSTLGPGMSFRFRGPAL